ncbi:hypothetical protein K2F54_02010 [Cryobacterium sp. 1639]|uniref:hypothetical protein n=1 Tax=Cryobacterium inferilacus TaxID=2866629 RepID=UPI001C7385B3|nr:hypothetical protein [Cryobacterium sp. 1639]MBX0298743.1 hypothetical protein [Cryobacterium sp. 1639]
MISTGTDKKWFDEFVLELRLQQVYGSAIGDAVASARELLADTGQSAQEAFGSARDYAASLDLPRAPRFEWVRQALWPTMVSLLALLLFTQAAAAWTQSEPFLVSPAQLILLAAPVFIVAALPLYLAALVRHVWVVVVLVVACGLSGLLSSIVAPTTAADAWLALDPLPWLIGCSVVMVALAIVQTVRSRRPGSNDEIINPLGDPTVDSGRGARLALVLTNWIFPVLALVMLGFVSLFR